MKKRIFIAIHYLELGGAETSLIGLLHALNPEKVDVDLFVYSHQGALMKAIPPHVNLLPENKTWSMFEKPLKEVLKKGQLRMFFARMKAKRQMKEYVKRVHPSDGSAIFGFLGKEVSKVLSDINPGVEYDLVISYLHPHDFVLDYVRAKKRLCWIHTDYSAIDVNVEIELPVWGAYDHIVSISPDVTKSFLLKFPSLKDKILEVENILPVALIKARANDNDNFLAKENDNQVTLLSVGRICEAKNYDNIPYVATELKKLLLSPSLTFRWYIVGPGNHDDIDALSKELGVDDVVIFLGPSSNPYPYIKACDIYVQPSRYEGKSVTVREAQMLCKPVVVTNYSTASSQIQDGIDGVIVPMDNESCARSLAEFILDNEKQKRIIEHLQSHDYGNVSEVEKIYKILNQ